MLLYQCSCHKCKGKLVTAQVKQNHHRASLKSCTVTQQKFQKRVISSPHDVAQAGPSSTHPRIALQNLPPPALHGHSEFTFSSHLSNPHVDLTPSATSGAHLDVFCPHVADHDIPFDPGQMPHE